MLVFIQVGDRLDECKRYEANWMNAISICGLSAEAAYNAGMFMSCYYVLIIH